MLKLFGSLLIAVASVGFSLSYCAQLRAHLELLYGIRQMFTDMFHAAAYSLLPMESILQEEHRHWEPRLLEIAGELSEGLEKKQGGRGEEIWKQIFLQNQESLALHTEELEIVMTAGTAFFGKSREENERNYTLCMERLEFVIENTRGEQKEKQKVCRTLGITCGLMLIILLI